MISVRRGIGVPDMYSCLLWGLLYADEVALRSSCLFNSPDQCDTITTELEVTAWVNIQLPNWKVTFNFLSTPSGYSWLIITV